jgi:D-sedoheptulose 7-phosphate isomerase
LRTYARQYHQDFLRTMANLRVTEKTGEAVDFFYGVETGAALILRQTSLGRKLIFVGNGASAGMASHMAADFLKNGRMRTVTFNDGPLLTCMGNDYGYECVFEEPLKIVADSGDLLVAISSSGRSDNILRAVRAARDKDCYVLTLSGFDQDNPLSATGDINFYVPSSQYGPVEIAHQFIIHCILDTILENRFPNNKRGS